MFFATVDRPLEAKLARVARRWTQWQLAQRAGVAPWAVSAYEPQRRYVPPSWVARIRAALGLDVAS